MYRLLDTGRISALATLSRSKAEETRRRKADVTAVALGASSIIRRPNRDRFRSAPHHQMNLGYPLPDGFRFDASDRTRRSWITRQHLNRRIQFIRQRRVVRTFGPSSVETADRPTFSATLRPIRPPRKIRRPVRWILSAQVDSRSVAHAGISPPIFDSRTRVEWGAH
jgi:hypothetical protein